MSTGIDAISGIGYSSIGPLSKADQNTAPVKGAANRDITAEGPGDKGCKT